MEAMHTSMGLVAPHPGPIVSMADQVKGRCVPTKVISAAGSTLFPGSRRLKCGIAPQRIDKTAGRRKIVAVSAGEVSDQAEPMDTAVEPEPIETEEARSSGVMFMTDDPSEIEKAIRKIEAENQALREKVALAKLESLAEPGLETEERSVDVTRPRLGAVAPSLAGVQAPAPSTLPSKVAGKGSVNTHAIAAVLQADSV